MSAALSSCFGQRVVATSVNSVPDHICIAENSAASPKDFLPTLATALEDRGITVDTIPATYRIDGDHFFANWSRSKAAECATVLAYLPGWDRHEAKLYLDTLKMALSDGKKSLGTVNYAAPNGPMKYRRAEVVIREVLDELLPATRNMAPVAHAPTAAGRERASTPEPQESAPAGEPVVHELPPAGAAAAEPAAPPTPSPAAPPAPEEKPELAEKLKTLKAAYDQGLLTKDEYEAKKKALQNEP